MSQTDASDAERTATPTGVPSGSPASPPETHGLTVWAEIDLAALEANVRTLRALAPTSEFMAVVKADAYGHGLLPVARAAVRGGATWLGVAQFAEAFALRDAGITTRLLTWLSVPGADFAGAVERDVDLSASAPWVLDEIASAASALGRTARVHLKVDTGLGRGGAFGADWTTLVQHARRHEAERHPQCRRHLDPLRARRLARSTPPCWPSRNASSRPSPRPSGRVSRRGAPPRQLRRDPGAPLGPRRPRAARDRDVRPDPGAAGRRRLRPATPS